MRKLLLAIGLLWVTAVQAETVAVLPVDTGQSPNRAFSDVVWLFSKEWANALQLKRPDLTVLNPMKTISNLEEKGLKAAYHHVTQSYAEGGQPEGLALLKQGGLQADTVVFVEAQLDYNVAHRPERLLDRVKALINDALPKEGTTALQVRLTAFDVTRADPRILWIKKGSQYVPDTRFYNATPSVLADTDSRLAFSKASRDLSQRLLWRTDAWFKMR
jgi:hypothetical protein